MPDRTLKKLYKKIWLGYFKYDLHENKTYIKKPENCKVVYKEEINSFVLNLEQNKLNVKRIN